MEPSEYLAGLAKLLEERWRVERRDRIAMLVLAAIISTGEPLVDVVQWSVKYADALIAEMDK